MGASSARPAVGQAANKLLQSNPWHRSMVPGLRAMADHIGGDGLDAFERATRDFERRTVAANAATAGCQ